VTNLDAQVIAVLSRSAMLPASVLSGDKRLADLGIGSLEQIECILALEDEFKIEFPDTNLQKLETVQDLVDFVRRAAPPQPGRTSS
jgi:acyl carrier protein